LVYDQPYVLSALLRQCVKAWWFLPPFIFAVPQKNYCAC
jgi:hypothetical protein